MVKKVLIAFDCDHTLIDETIDTYVLQLLPNAGQLPRSIEKLYSIHHWNDYQREVFRYLHASHVTKDQLLACIDEMPMVKGMRELLEYLAATKTAGGGSIHGAEKCDVMNGVARVPVAVENGVNRSVYSQTDGNTNSSDSSVQFDVIVVSDANLVSTIVTSFLHNYYCPLFALSSHVLFCHCFRVPFV